MNTPKINGIIRHVLTLIGGIAIALGWISEDQLAEGITLIVGAVGAVMALYAFVKSFFDPTKNVTESQYQALKRAS